MGGGDGGHSVQLLAVGGPSPRGRGRRRAALCRHCRRGSIPAWAGATRPPAGRPAAWRVHPRVGGGDSQYDQTGVLCDGPSPRGRGRLTWPQAREWARRSIPAWAGATMRSTMPTSPTGVHPRVGGGDSSGHRGHRVRRGPSPRGRGRRVHPHRLKRLRGSIPAWAGATLRAHGPRPAHEVHPRVGGGDSPARWKRWRWTGPSPRGRGRLHEEGDAPRLDRSIPAWAGATA